MFWVITDEGGVTVADVALEMVSVGIEGGDTRRRRDILDARLREENNPD